MNTITMKPPSKPVRTDSKQGRFYIIDDQKYPSVTTILQVMSKPALVQWAAKEERLMTIQAAADLYEDIHSTPRMARTTFVTTLDTRIGRLRANQKLLAKASEIGTQIHTVIEWNIRRSLGQIVGPSPELSDEAAWAFMAYEKWAQSVNLKPVLIEQTVFSRQHRYAGTMDLLAEVNGMLTLVDFKTGKTVYKEAMLQNVAYQSALAEMGHQKADAGLILRLPKIKTDPNFEAVPVPLIDTLYPVFLSVKAVWEWWYAEEQASRAEWEAAKKEKAA